MDIFITVYNPDFLAYLLPKSKFLSLSFGEKVAEDKMAATVAGRFGIDTFGIGEDSGQPVTSSYKPPFKFNGEIEEVVITID